MDEIPSAESVASVRLEHGNEQSGVAVAGVPARSPRPAGPPHSPEAAVTTIPPVSPKLAAALLVGAAAVAYAMTPPEAESPQWEDIILAS